MDAIKDLILSKVLEALRQKLSHFEEALSRNEESLKNAPTAMESASDKSRFQYEQMSDNLRLILEQIKRAIKDINSNSKKSDYISSGSIIKIKDELKVKYAVICSYSLEKPLEVNGEEIKVVSMNTPIAKCLMGKKKGDESEMEIMDGSRKIKILEVY